MADINLKHFVDINIQNHVPMIKEGIRSTAVLFTPEGTDNEYIEATSYDDLVAKTTDWDPNTRTLAYGKIYFDNGGVKLRIIEGISYNEITSTMISELSNDYIIVAYAANDTDRVNAYIALRSIAKSRESDTDIYGINEKMILCGIKLTDSGVLDGSSAQLLYTDTANIKNFVVKASSVIGAEMSVAAYLSQINVYETNSIYDYNFTREELIAENVSDNIFSIVQTNNININVELVGESTVCGGDCKNGDDLVNNFVRIILHQTLSEKLISLLTQKIKSTDGLSKIYSTIVQELNNYLLSGYLTTDKIWKDNDLIVTYPQGSSHKFTIIEKGTALINGYIIKILPFNSLSDSDKAAHKVPPIYIVIADQYGIRAITINGEVI